MARRNNIQDDDLYRVQDIDLIKWEQWLPIKARYRITDKELQVAKLACKRSTNKEIAKELKIAVGTVKTHLKSIFAKIPVHNKISMLLKFAKDANVDLITEEQWLYLQERYELSPRELEVAKIICTQGLTREKIAEELGISPHTAKVHLDHIFAKTWVPDKFALLLRFLEAVGVGTTKKKKRKKSIKKVKRAKAPVKEKRRKTPIKKTKRVKTQPKKMKRKRKGT